MSPAQPSMDLDHDTSPQSHLSPLPVSVDHLALSRLQSRPLDDDPLARALHLAALSWHLRQRDTAVALQLADQAQALLPPGAEAAQSRLTLVRAEAAWLAADLPRAEQLALGALAGFTRAQDARGSSDAHAMLGHVLFDQSQFVAARQSLQQAQRLAQAAGDLHREQGAQAVMAYWGLVDDGEAAELQWLPVIDRLRTSADPRVAMWAHDFLGQLHARHGRHAQAIAAFSTTSERARDAGQVRRRVVACTNVAACYSNLNDHDAALEWIDAALALARPAGWPASVGLCLMMTGNSLYLLGRLHAARQALEEAMEVLKPLPRSRTRLVAQNYTLDVLLDLGETAQATALARSTLAGAQAAGMDDLACDVQRALAKALLQQGLTSEAIDTAEQALQWADRVGSLNRSVDLLLVLAQAHAPAAAPGEAPRASLPHLQRALELGACIDGFDTPHDTFEAAARELALAGDPAQAYALMVQANAALDRESAREASHRLQALEVQRETRLMQAEAAALRAQAAAAQREADALQSANALLEQLGAAGRDITAQRDVSSICQRVLGQLRAVLDVQQLSVWLLDEPTGVLQRHFGTGPERVPLDSPGGAIARCARLEQELLVEGPHPLVGPQHPMPDDLPVGTTLFGPLRAAPRLVGVLCIQSGRPQAYGEPERLVFRSVCGWTAIALNNCALVGELDTTLRQLAGAHEAERQAREQAEQAVQLKGEVLANISHDLRTPLASLHGYLETLLLSPAGLGEDDRTRYLNTALAQSAKVSRLAAALMELAQLESGWLQPVYHRFALHGLLVEVVRKLELAAHARHQRVRLTLPPQLPDAWADPDMIDRVLTNLLDNAIQYAPPGSEVCVDVRVDLPARPDELTVTVLDTGPGIPAELRDTLFTRPSTVAQAHRPGGGGLGLLIVQRLVQQHGCDIRLVARAGPGAAFEFGVPRWPG